MATSTQEWIDELKSISVLELSERIKALEEEFGVSATAVAAAAPAGGRRWRRGRCRGGGADRVRRRPHRRRRQEDPGHQGRPRGDRPRPQGGQGARRRGAQGDQGGRRARGGRQAQGRARGGRRERRGQVGGFRLTSRTGGRRSRRPPSFRAPSRVAAPTPRGRDSSTRRARHVRADRVGIGRQARRERRRAESLQEVGAELKPPWPADSRPTFRSKSDRPAADSLASDRDRVYGRRRSEPEQSGAAARDRRLTKEGMVRKTIVACALVALAVGATTATAAQLITGKQIKNGSITGKDIEERAGAKLRRARPGRLRRKASIDKATGPSRRDPRGRAPARRATRAARLGPPSCRAPGNWGSSTATRSARRTQQLRSGPFDRAGGNGSLNLGQRRRQAGRLADRRSWPTATRSTSPARRSRRRRRRLPRLPDGRETRRVRAANGSGTRTAPSPSRSTRTSVGDEQLLEPGLQPRPTARQTPGADDRRDQRPGSGRHRRRLTGTPPTAARAPFDALKHFCTHDGDQGRAQMRWSRSARHKGSRLRVARRRRRPAHQQQGLRLRGARGRGAHAVAREHVSPAQRAVRRAALFSSTVKPGLARADTLVQVGR